MSNIIEMQTQEKRKIIMRRAMMCLLVCMLVVNIHADNFMRVAVKGGASSNPAHDTLSIGGGAGMEVGFRSQNSNGWFVDVGLGVDYGVLNDYKSDSTSMEHKTDYQGDAYVANQQFDRLRNQHSAFSFVLPIMGGYEYERFYIMAGVQLKGGVIGRSQTRGFMTETLEYDNLIDNLQTKEYDFYGDIYRVGPSFDVQVSGEIGLQLTRDRRISPRKAHLAMKNLYLSVFVDYTVFTTRPVMPLTAGLKLTCLMQLKAKKKCVCLSNIQKKRRRR